MKRKRAVWAGALCALALGAVTLLGGTASASPTNNVVYFNIRYSSGNWQGFQAPAQPPDQCCDAIATASDAFNDTTHVDVVTISGLWDNVRYSNGSWQGWARPRQPPGAILHMAEDGGNDGTIYFLAYTTTGLYWTYRLQAGTWASSWYSVSRPAGIIETVTVAYNSLANQMQATITASGVVWHNIMSTTTLQWQGWQQPTQPPSGAFELAAAEDYNGNVQFMAVSENNVLYHDIRYSNGTWQGWRETVQPPATDGTQWSFGDLSAADDGGGEAQFTVNRYNSGSTTTFFHTIRNANGTWQGYWAAPAMPSTVCNGPLAVTTQTYLPGPWDFHFVAYCW